MKPLRIIFLLLLLILFSINFGCNQPETFDENSDTAENVDDILSYYVNYAPVKIDIMPLTELLSPGNTQQSTINIYVSLLDQFGSQVKSPGTFRFELYQYMQRSSEPKGKRAVIWPDLNLTDPVINNSYWLDFLRAYEFSFPCEQTGNQDYILQVTCLCPNGKRLSSEFSLRQTK